MHQCIKFILFWNDNLHVSDGLSVHHQEYKTLHTATGTCQTDTAVCGYSLTSRQQYLFDKCLLLYVQSWTPDDGRKDRPKHVECHSKIKQIWYTGACSWFYYRNNITMHGPMNVKFFYTDTRRWILVIDVPFSSFCLLNVYPHSTNREQRKKPCKNMFLKLASLTFTSWRNKLWSQASMHKNSRR